MTQIRPATAPDLPQVLDMARRLATLHGDRASLTLEDLNRDTLGPMPWVTLLVAEGGQDLLGYAALTPMMQLQFGARGMDLHHLFVCENARAQGVGRALIQSATEHAKLLKCSYIAVGTDPGNTRAQSYYRQAGFSQTTPGPRFRLRLD